jgi:hypothetical protein
VTVTVAATPVLAPPAPGGWGSPLPRERVGDYLDALRGWCDGRRAELDELDGAALAAGTSGAGLTGDLTLAMALWQDVRTRADRLLAVWNGPTVGTAELTTMAGLVWGRHSVAGASPATTTETAGAGGAAGPSTGGGGGGGMTLPEVCAMSDALTASLRTRLNLTVAGADTLVTVRELRAASERVRVLAREAAPGERMQAEESWARLDRRVRALAETAARGGDVGGLLGPLGSDLARSERDLMVAAATARTRREEIAATGHLADRLRRREVEVEAVVARCVRTCAPAPVLGVPQVDALGPMPTDASVTRYRTRLDAVARALERVHETYSAPLAELESLTGLLQASAAQAAATGREAYPELRAVRETAERVLAARPVDLPRARALVGAFRGLLEAPAPALTPSGAPLPVHTKGPRS